VGGRARGAGPAAGGARSSGAGVQEPCARRSSREQRAAGCSVSAADGRSREWTCVQQKHAQGSRGAVEAGSAAACLQAAWRPGHPHMVRPCRVLGVGRLRPRIVMRLRLWRGKLGRRSYAAA
jgi:hypothetical protein